MLSCRKFTGHIGGYECVNVGSCACVCYTCPLFQDHRFSDEIDKLTGYKTQSILCMAICNSDGEVIGVVQAINKNPIGTPFTEDDEKVRMCYVSQLKKKTAFIRSISQRVFLLHCILLAIYHPQNYCSRSDH